MDEAFYRASAAIRREERNEALEIAAPLRTQPTSYGTVVSEALLGLGRADAAADTLIALVRDGYHRRHLLGRAHLARGDTARARDLLRDVVTWHQVGAWYWLHEYVVRRRDALALLDSIDARIGSTERPLLNPRPR